MDAVTRLPAPRLRVLVQAAQAIAEAGLDEPVLLATLLRTLVSSIGDLATVRLRPAFANVAGTANLSQGG